VVSYPTLKRRMIRGWSPRRLRHLQFLPTPRRDRLTSAPVSSFTRKQPTSPLLGAKPITAS